MPSANHRKLKDPTMVGLFDWTWPGTITIPRPVSPMVVIIFHVIPNDSKEMFFVQDHDVIQAFPA